MTDPTLRESFRFMRENAGYRTPPGRAMCALELARAEQRLRAAVDAGDLRVVVDYDHYHEPIEHAGPCVPEPSNPQYAEFVQWRAWWERQIETGALEIVTVALVDDEGCYVASLGSVDSSPSDGYSFPLSGYRRVVAAELADEFFHEIDRERSERGEWEARDTVTV